MMVISPYSQSRENYEFLQMMSKVGLTVHALLGPILHTGVVSFKRNINQKFSTHENTR